MTAKTFIPSVRFCWGETWYEVVQKLPDKHLLLCDISTGQQAIHALDVLTTALYDGTLYFAQSNEEDLAYQTQFHYPTLEDCPAHLAQSARVRFAFLEPLLEKKTSKRDIEQYIAQVLETCDMETRRILGAGLTVRTVYRWLKRLREYDNDPRALVPRVHQCGNPQVSRLDVRVEQIICEAKDAMGVRETIIAAHDEIQLRIREYNALHPTEAPIPVPSRSTVARRRTSLQQKQREAQPARQYGQFELPGYPLERVEIDHTATDVIVVDEEDHLPLGRLTLTYCVDVKTRLVTGYYLGFEPPSYLAVAECLYHAILPKSDWRALYGTENTLKDVYGIPFAIATDNGQEFHSQHFSDALALLGIRHDAMPRSSPEKKPFVERLFRTLNSGLFHISPGTISNILARRHTESKSEACIYLSQIDRALAIFLAIPSPK